MARAMWEGAGPGPGGRGQGQGYMGGSVAQGQGKCQVGVVGLAFTAGSHYCCMSQDSLNGDQLTAQFCD